MTSMMYTDRIFLTTPFYKTRIWAQFSLETKTKKYSSFPNWGNCHKKEGVEKEFKEQVLQNWPFIGQPPAARQAWKLARAPAAAHPAASLLLPPSPPASRQGTAHPHGRAIHPSQMGKLPNWESKQGNFPKSKNGGNCCPNLESTKFGGGWQAAQHYN
ncbi:hypothetical protein DSO57_1023343 [Entomophthora muscae]|uniref:Uncharacterized protein n=1 Tax=Entomophthora muscae TaxID=34485 RepID=A0ACC2RHU2_9FUNG|nr:hypothetical protein DSO57_1023343 [Entomophthora muscae]